MVRTIYSEEDREYVFKRDEGHCKTCHHKLNFYNRHKGEVGAWQMGHRRADAKGGSPHLRNIVALCWSCNHEQGTKSFTDFDRGFEYDNNKDKAKSFLNKYVVPEGTFDMAGARRSISVESELEDFRKKVKNNSRDWADNKYAELRPLARRFESTNDPKYEKYSKMCRIMLEYHRNGK